MRSNLSEKIKVAVKKAIQEAQMGGAIVDAYHIAEHVLEQHPHENALLGDIVDWMIEHHSITGALELSPPAIILEIILPEGAKTATGGLD